jgi:hypothetical protein
MKEVRESYLALIAELQLHLLHEYPRKCWIPVSSDNFTYFKQQAASSPISKPQAPSSPVPAPSGAPLYPRKTLPPKAKPPPPLPEPEEKKESHSAAAPLAAPFAKEPFAKTAPPDLSEMRKLVAEKHPKWEYVEPPFYKEKGAPVLLLGSKADILLHQIGQAIQNQLKVAAEVFDLEEVSVRGGVLNVLDRRGLQLIIIDENGLRRYPELLKKYRPNLGVIGEIRVIVLTDLATLAQDAQRKKAIWNTIKEKLS